jgi:hypothetical protein
VLIANAAEQPAGLGLAVDASRARLAAAGEVRVEAERLSLGRVDGGALFARAREGLALNGPVTLAGSAELRAGAGGLSVNAPLLVGGDVIGLSDGDLTLAAQVTGRGLVELDAARDLAIRDGVRLSTGGGDLATERRARPARRRIGRRRRRR